MVSRSTTFALGLLLGFAAPLTAQQDCDPKPAPNYAPTSFDDVITLSTQTGADGAVTIPTYSVIATATK